MVIAFEMLPREAQPVLDRWVGVSRTRELIEIVQRQAPGTWLPLVINRDGQALEVIAKFPSHR